MDTVSTLRLPITYFPFSITRSLDNQRKTYPGALLAQIGGVTQFSIL